MSGDDVKAGDFEDITEEDLANLDMDMDMDADESQSLFFSLTVKPTEDGKDIEQPPIEGCIVHITNACFGAQVQKGSRTVVICEISDAQVPICVLTQGTHENHSLDLLYNESATFVLRGSKMSAVTLTGYYQPPIFVHDNDDDQLLLDPEMEDQQLLLDQQNAKLKEYISKHQMEAMLDISDNDNNNNTNKNDDEEEEEVEREEADDAQDSIATHPPPSKKRKKIINNNSNNNAVNSNSHPREKASVAAPQPIPVQQSSQMSPKDDQQLPEQPPADNTPTKSEKSNNKNKKKKKKKNKERKLRTMKGGIQLRDMKVGTGNKISAHGQRLNVFFVGQTTDGTVFDKSIAGDGFSFILGAGEAIKGWDMGLRGMKVGGKRRLKIPSKLAYGETGKLPKIPPNSDLTFTVELRGINAV